MFAGVDMTGAGVNSEVVGLDRAVGDLAWGERVVGVSGVDRVVAGFDGIDSAVAEVEREVDGVDRDVDWVVEVDRALTEVAGVVRAVAWGRQGSGWG